MPIMLTRKDGPPTPFRNAEYIPFYYFIPKSILSRCGAELNAIPRNPQELFRNRAACEFVESILVEGVLESMAEYYSVELSQKIHRGIAINAEKCLSNGSNPGLGFKVDAERRFYVDEEEAAIVREIYERYASGETKAEIIRDLKRRRVKTSLGKEFSPNSLSHLLSNKRYIGVYLYKGKETPGGMPRILDDDLFYRVQSMMNKNKNAPARTHGEGEYLLTTKLFCGHCKEMMVGYGGTSKTGRQYHYYMCKNARRKKCGKKIVSKSYIEDRVVNECLKMLTEEKIRFIAKKVAEECAKSPDNLTAKALKNAIREADTAIENLWKAIEQGRAVEMLTDRLNKRMAEKAELEAQLAIEENKKITLTEAQILAFLDYVCEMPADDVNKRRAIINIFVHSIYLYDDHFTLIINASKKPLSIDNIPLDDIETAFEGETGASEGCSSLSTPAPSQPQSRKALRFFVCQPNDTSKTIITLKPAAKNRVPTLECFPWDISGISSSTTTYSMAPAAKLSRYGSARVTYRAAASVSSAPTGSTTPEKTPPAKARPRPIPSAFKGNEIMAPSGKF